MKDKHCKKGRFAGQKAKYKWQTTLIPNLDGDQSMELEFGNGDGVKFKNLPLLTVFRWTLDKNDKKGIFFVKVGKRSMVSSIGEKIRVTNASLFCLPVTCMVTVQPCVVKPAKTPSIDEHIN